MTLLERVLQRDEKAWRELVRSHEGRLRVVIAESAEAIHPLADDDGDDILGDFWLMLLEDDLRRLRSFDGDNLVGWLSLLASQVAANAARKLARGPRFESLDTVREIAVAPPADGYLRTTEAAA